MKENYHQRPTIRDLDRVDGLLPAGVLLRSSGQAVVFVQVQLEPHGQGIKLTLLVDRQTDPLDLPGGEALQFLDVSLSISIRAKQQSYYPDRRM